MAAAFRTHFQIETLEILQTKATFCPRSTNQIFMQKMKLKSTLLQLFFSNPVAPVTRLEQKSFVQLVLVQKYERSVD